MAACASANNTRVSVGAGVNVKARRCAFEDARQQEDQGYRFAPKLHTCTVPPPLHAPIDMDTHVIVCMYFSVSLLHIFRCICIHIQVWKEGEIVKKKGKDLLTFDHIYKPNEGWSISVCLKLFLFTKDLGITSSLGIIRVVRLWLFVS